MVISNWYNCILYGKYFRELSFKKCISGIHCRCQFSYSLCSEMESDFTSHRDECVALADMVFKLHLIVKLYFPIFHLKNYTTV